jgi:hypothetical protein
MRKSKAHFDTAASSVETKSYDTAILVTYGLFLIGMAAGGYALARIYGFERETLVPLFWPSVPFM